MFNGKRYITRGIKENIRVDMQIYMWKLIDKLKRKENFQLDYLQVFKLEPKKIDGLTFQKIIHKQEVEPYSDTKIVSVSDIVSKKIFVISSTDEEGQEYSTMMLSNEY
ncbi:MAG: hypothetical protein FH753_06835 [Firmicutes bacterium]|nr:hypothetical protein [Bacillota bacterium]